MIVEKCTKNKSLQENNKKEDGRNSTKACKSKLDGMRKKIEARNDE